MKLKLTSGKYGNKFVEFDEKYFEKIKDHHWHLAKRHDRFYARASIWVSTNKYKQQYMHRLIMNAKSDMQVDHIDRDGLNNKRNNLRITPVIGGRNMQNRAASKNNTTGYKGVHFYGKGRLKGKYSAKIEANGVKVWGGYFGTAIEAAKRVNELCEIHHKDFACYNLFSKAEEKMLIEIQPTGKPLLALKKYPKPFLRGVSMPIRATKRKPYSSKVMVNGQMHFLGYFETEILAAMAYNEAIIKLGGNISFLNTIPNE